MKLRNKKTGEIKDIQTIIHEAFTVHGVEVLKNLEANWEDYKPAEPLIKDEKVRKVVRAWAEVNDFYRATVYEPISCKYWYLRGDNGKEVLDLDIFGKFPKELFDNSSYTIEELCGEEEEE